MTGLRKVIIFTILQCLFGIREISGKFFCEFDLCSDEEFCCERNTCCPLPDPYQTYYIIGGIFLVLLIILYICKRGKYLCRMCSQQPDKRKLINSNA